MVQNQNIIDSHMINVYDKVVKNSNVDFIQIVFAMNRQKYYNKDQLFSNCRNVNSLFIAIILMNYIVLNSK